MKAVPDEVTEMLGRSSAPSPAHSAPQACLAAEDPVRLVPWEPTLSLHGSFQRVLCVPSEARGTHGGSYSPAVLTDL